MALYAELLLGITEVIYKGHFVSKYCRRAILTFDGIEVSFKVADFEHAFYESSDRRGAKDCFSIARAERMDWIERILQDSTAELYYGWNKETKSYNRNSRVALVVEGYVVIIRFTDTTRRKARFVTAYPTSKAPTGSQKLSTFDQIRSGPKWT